MNKEEIFDIFYGKEKWDVYDKFKKIESSIDSSDYLYKYYELIKEMLKDERSYIRVRGFKIICKLALYDNENKIDKDLTLLLSVLDSNKPTEVRLCLESIKNLLIYKNNLKDIIYDKIKKIDYLKFKDTMSPLIKKDIDNLLNS